MIAVCSLHRLLSISSTFAQFVCSIAIECRVCAMHEFCVYRRFIYRAADYLNVDKCSIWTMHDDLTMNPLNFEGRARSHVCLCAYRVRLLCIFVYLYTHRMRSICFINYVHYSTDRCNCFRITLEIAIQTFRSNNKFRHGTHRTQKQYQSNCLPLIFR